LCPGRGIMEDKKQKEQQKWKKKLRQKEKKIIKAQTL
jgi:hypothetical protein